MRTIHPAIQTDCRQWTVQLPDTDFRYHRRPILTAGSHLPVLVELRARSLMHSPAQANAV